MSHESCEFQMRWRCLHNGTVMHTKWNKQKHFSHCEVLKRKPSLQILCIWLTNTNWCQPCAALPTQLFKMSLDMVEMLTPILDYYHIWPHGERSLLHPREGKKSLWNPIRNQANEKNTTFSYSITMLLLFPLYLKAIVNTHDIYSFFGGGVKKRH